MKLPIQLTVNGKRYQFEVEPWQTLLEVLSDNLKLTKTKQGCSVGECGSCAVIMDRQAVNSCLVLAVDADGKDIITAEGFAEEAEFHPFHEALVSQGSMRVSFEPPGTKPRQEAFTFCHICPGRCSIKVTVEDGKVVDIAPDMESGLPNELCPVKKSRLSIPEVLTHPDRLKYPQKRVGARGEGKWERISWDEALDTIAQKLTALKEKYGPECVAVGLGEPKGMEFAFAQRFATVFGTPNVVTPGWCCGVPQALATAFTHGYNCVPDEEYLPHLLVLWGINVNHTSSAMRRESIESALAKGAKLIVVDTNKTDVAAIADLWIKPRPISDGALAMGVLKVIIEEKLYDEDMATDWTVGFDQLQEEIKTFSLKEVEEVTWVPEAQIREFARLYAQTKPAAIQWGNSLDNNVNSFQADRAIDILRAITGNLNIPGGDVFLTPAPFTRPGRFFFPGKLSRNEDKAVGREFKLAVKSAFIPPHSFVKAVLASEPYPIRAGVFMLTNPIISYPDSAKVFQAFMKLEFIVVSELFMTPTAALADILLPAAWGMEHEELGYWTGWYEEIRAYPKLVEPPGECWADTRWINELAKRLGIDKHFWESDEEALDYMLWPSGLTYKDFKQKKRTLYPKREYKEHDYKTPSGKVEIFSHQLKELGYSPMPLWKELSKLPQPSTEYPLLLTNAKEIAYMLSGYKNIPSLRNIKPEPVVQLNPKTAQKLGLKDGDWVYIENNKGKIGQRLTFNSDLDPRVVMASFGWWFPEQASTIYGWNKSNINILTRSEPPYDPTNGAVDIRGIPCRVYKA
jgi:anaerobic selenocysteine-containing dehydrogenase